MKKKFNSAGLIIIFAVWASFVFSDEELDSGISTESVWTHSKLMEHFVEAWIKSGRENIPTIALPSEVIEHFDIKSETVGPEVLFSNEVQGLMKELQEEGKISLIRPLPSDPSQEVTNPFQGTEFGEMLNLAQQEDGLMKLTEVLAEKSGYSSVSNLPPDLVIRIENIHKYLNQLSHDVSQTYERQYELDIYGIGGIPSHERTHDIRMEHTELDVNEAIQELALEDQSTLQALGDTVYDRRKLVSRMGSMSMKEALATHRLLSQIDGRRNPPELGELNKDLQDQIRVERERGYQVRPFETIPTSIMSAIIESSKSQVKGNHAPLINGVFNREIFSLESVEGKMATQDSVEVPQNFLSALSENFVVLEQGAITRFYSESVFGGAFMIREEKLEGFGVWYSNLTIAGNDALVIPAQYRDGAWSTNLYAFDGQRRLSFFVEGKLIGDELKQFNELATLIVEQGLNR